MKRLGTIEDVSYRGMLIVRPDFRVHHGARVLDNRKRDVGTVVGVFGPAARPFVLIKPLRNGEKGADMVGATVFIA